MRKGANITDHGIILFLNANIGSLTLKSERDVALRSGLMGGNMRGGGKTTNQTGRGEKSKQTEISMKVIGRIMRLMDLASSLPTTDTDMKETGKRTSITVKALKPILMGKVTRVAS